jgi:putative ABC transport system substrate-binding protein
MKVCLRRRNCITLLGGAAAWPIAARAQQADRVRRIGVLISGGDENDVAKSNFVAFPQALAGFGWADGRNVRIDVRGGGGDINRIRAFAHELVGLHSDIVVTTGAPATAALKRETQTIPIVFANVGDPVASGMVTRLDRPNGNITGFATYEATLGGKWLELLSEIAPGLNRAAIMFNPDIAAASADMPSFETAARSLKVEPIVAPIHSDIEIQRAIIALGHEPGSGFVVPPDAFILVHRASTISAAARNNVPAIYHVSTYAREGGLLSYGVDRGDVWRHRHLCRSHSTRREAGRSPGVASGEIRDDREPQDRQCARSCDTAIDNAARR